MNFFEKYALKIFLAMTPFLKERFNEFAMGLYVKALETDNTADDVAANCCLISWAWKVLRANNGA